MEQSGEERSELILYLRLLWRHKWILVLTALLGVAGALGVDSRRTPVYQGTATILFISQNYSGPGQVEPLQSSDLQTDIELMQSSAVYFQVVHDLHQQRPPAPIVTQLGETDTASIVVHSSNAAFAAAAANAYARAFVQVTESQFLNTQRSVENQLQNQIDSVNSQIANVEAQISGTKDAGTLANLNAQLGNLEQDLQSLRAQLTEIQVQVSQSPSAGRIITQATVDRSPISPKRAQDIVIFGIMGLVLGIAISIVRELVDDRIRDKESMTQVTHGLPTLGLIPKVEGWRKKDAAYLVSAGEPQSSSAEAYRGLRTSIQFLGLDKPVRTLQITSPVATEGKTATAANLAVTIAQSGHRVVLVSCDLRRPRIHEFFGISNDVGFTSILVGNVNLHDALVTVPGYDSLKVLPSGPIPPNPSELLGLPQSAQIFAELSEHADVVIIDSPPVMPVTDAAVLAAIADAVLLVIAAHSTRKRDVRHALETLEQVGARVVGVVLNRASHADSYGYYKYEYRPKDGEPRMDDVPAEVSNGNGNGNGSGEPLSRRARRVRQS